jgi:arabinogalactan endo-1,4-beta-galactosidase
VEDYTTTTLKAFVDAGCAPEYVQLGNEITHGFLWPVGRNDDPAGWAAFAELLGAGARGVRRTLPTARIVLHADCGGKADVAVWFFGQMRAYRVPYDVIGLSYYPQWQGGIANLRTTLERCAREFDKDVMVVETAAAWRRHDQSRIEGWTQSPEGQREYARDVLKAVRETPKDRGRGVLWWYPESVLTRGLHVWEGGAMALFDDSGRELPALKALGGQ